MLADGGTIDRPVAAGLLWVLVLALAVSLWLSAVLDDGSTAAAAMARTEVELTSDIPSSRTRAAVAERVKVQFWLTWSRARHKAHSLFACVKKAHLVPALWMSDFAGRRRCYKNITSQTNQSVKTGNHNRKHHLSIIKSRMLIDSLACARLLT